MTILPSLIDLTSPQEYFDYYMREFCRNAVFTYDGLRVLFSQGRFWHAFSVRDEKGKKDEFSFERAKYISWIKPTLEHPDAILLQGWNSDTKQYEPHRRVSIVLENFIVVIEIDLSKSRTIEKAKFRTAFPGIDRTIAKLRQSPKWDKQLCINHLLEK